MARVWRSAILFIIALLAINAFATTYYVAANGSDSNNGTSKTTPWLHAPGMTGCAANCATATPQSGDRFIVRGGDTWHTSAASPTGLPWSWNWNNTTITVDKTWFTGTAWSRPILNDDNTIRTSVGSCAHDQSNNTMVDISGSTVTFDNFEMVGFCWSGNPSFSAHYIHPGSSNVISNNYIHGWSHASGAVDQAYFIYSDDHYEFAYNVIDGSDSPPDSGFAMYRTCNNIHHNVFRYLSNAVVCYDLTEFHDNLVEYISESFDGSTHGNVAEWNSTAGPVVEVYNNVVRHIPNLGVGYWIWLDTGAAGYFYNNLIYDITSPGGITGNCIDVSGSGSGTQSLRAYNNTILNEPCQFRFATNGNTPCFSGTATFANNHFIGFSNFSATNAVDSGCRPTLSEAAGDVYQTEAAANSQGYVPSNGYAPTGSSDITIGAGTNLSSVCSSSNALCTDTTFGVALGSNGTVIAPARTPDARPTTSAWNVGAYQFSGSTAGNPAPPTGLAALVN